MDISDKYPPFELGKCLYNQATFTGRLKHFFNMVDPRTLLTSQKELDRAVRLLDDFKDQGHQPGVTNEQLWKAQKTKQSIIHPDTGEKIFVPFRMSGYIVFGTPIIVGLLIPNATLGQTVFWQWINQTHNACVNYANRNATKPTPMSRFILGYGGAVTTAVGFAVGLKTYIERSSAIGASAKQTILKFVPFPAVAMANVCNIVLMRNSELATGIEVFDKQRNLVGTSKVAAKKALMETAITRIILPAPCLIIPPVLMGLVQRTSLLRVYPRLFLPLQTLFSLIGFGGGLPAAIAMFPQTSTISRDRLEPELQAATTEPFLYFNKGL